jgi:pyruvate,orthophosphate dikinase
LLPLQGKFGSSQKVAKLIEELRHPNIDWKFVMSGLRSYLFDFLHDVAPHADEVLPVVFHYITAGTVRGKGSSLRAADTFFDRYAFVIKNFDGGSPLKRHFNSFARDYVELLLRLSREGLYFDYVNAMARRCGALLLEDGREEGDITAGLAELLLSQYGLYVSRCITASPEEIDSLAGSLANNGGPAVLELLRRVTSGAYGERLARLEKAAALPGPELFAGDGDAADFGHNARLWEEICRGVKRSVEENFLSGDAAVLDVLGYLIGKSTVGSDAELQLFMSRTVASLCEAFSRGNRPELLRSIIDLVMPQLFGEIERGGNYQAAFTTIYNIGRTVIESGRIYLIDHFTDCLVRFTFRFPEFSGIASDWSIIVNSSHLENIRTWMRLIEINPPLMKKLAASLIVNLKLGGVFLKDTDVFQRDVSRLLNSNYRDVFYLVTSLAAVFPAFYHDIGATGDIRSFTERIDTNHRMNDLVHFIRKQVHVESSSRTVLLMQRVMDFWLTGRKEQLKNMVPSDVYEGLDTMLALDGLDGRKAARLMVDAAKKRFRAKKDERFWDFLDRMDPDEFLEFARGAVIDAEGSTGKSESIALFAEYFERKSPAEMGKMLRHVANRFGIDTEQTAIWKLMYELSDAQFWNLFDGAEKVGISRVNIEKLLNFLHVYRLLYDKYNFSDVRIIDRLEDYADQGIFAPPAFFFAALRGRDVYAALDALLVMQATLKEEILLSGTAFEPLDTIEFKRHIAFGIPSMYGSYKEKKFDTLRVFFHMNLVRSRLFEKAIEEIGMEEGRAFDLALIKKTLRLFFRAFLVDGLSNQEMITVMGLLDTPNMRKSQFRDIITHLLVIHGEVSDHFNETFKFVCREAIRTIGIDRISDRFLGAGGGTGDMDVIVDRFLRDQIMQSPLLQLFDNLLVEVRDYLARSLESEKDDICLNRRRWKDSKGFIVIPIKNDAPRKEGGVCAPVWEVGGKAHGLMFASRTGGVQVPDGFIISSEFYKRVKEDNIRNPRFRRKLIHLVRVFVDEFTGGRYAYPSKPVLLSARSGAVFSMPGVMDTITNVGITEEVLESMAKIDSWFAYDCYRRLIQDFGISSYGIDRGVFENLMSAAKADAGVDLKEKLTGGQMKLLTRKYRYVINDYGYSIPKDPYEQLLYAILAVFQSWDSEIARNYRQFVNISDVWGTAVIVQKMVFGNINPSNITGVVHSQYLGSEKLSLFGEYKTRAQGHDIVSGVARVFPVSEEQKKIHAKSANFPSMEAAFPVHYATLSAAVKGIRDSWGNDVEIEFTFEGSTLYILQIRGMTKHVFAVDEIDEEPALLQNCLLGQGLAASGGAVSGRAVFSIGRIDGMRKRHPGDKVILVRPETNPEDVIGLKKSDGILTCIGGMTSHAVLQMRRLEKSGVSDFSIMKIDEEKNEASIDEAHSRCGAVELREGDFITIDGNTGNVYQGKHRTRSRGMSNG